MTAYLKHIHEQCGFTVRNVISVVIMAASLGVDKRILFQKGPRLVTIYESKYGLTQLSQVYNSETIYKNLK